MFGTTTESAPATGSSCAGNAPTCSPLAHRSTAGAGASASTTTWWPRAVRTSGCSTCVPLNTDGNVRRKSMRETGPTTHTSSSPSCTLAAGVIIIPLA